MKRRQLFGATAALAVMAGLAGVARRGVSEVDEAPAEAGEGGLSKDAFAGVGRMVRHRR